MEKTAQAGTLESMDCLVTLIEAGDGRKIEISGGSAARFRTAMERRINEVLDALEASGLPVCGGLRVSVQDNGAMDVVLGARVETAYRRLVGGEAR